MRRIFLVKITKQGRHIQRPITKTFEIELFVIATDNTR